MKNRQLEEADIYKQIVCTDKKQVKSLMSKGDYKSLKNHIKFLFKHHNKVIVWNNINSFYGDGVTVSAFEKDSEDDIEYNPKYVSNI